MRASVIALSILALIAISQPAMADDKADAVKSAAIQAEAIKKIMSRFDADGDGNISDEEKANAVEQLKKDFAKGNIPPAEAAALQALMRRAQGGGGGPQFGANGFGGPGGSSGLGQQISPEMLKKFDKNKNGKLDDDEQKAAMAAMGPKKSRKEQLLEKLDLNGDGKVTQDERDQVAAERKAEAEEKKAAKSKKKADK